NIDDGAGSFNVTKNGAESLRLRTANTVDGTFTFNTSGSTVFVHANGAMGTTGQGTTVADGVTLRLLDNLNYSSAEPLALDGTLLANGTTTYAGTTTTTSDTH